MDDTDRIVEAVESAFERLVTLLLVLTGLILVNTGLWSVLTTR